MGMLYLVQAGLELREDVCHCIVVSLVCFFLVCCGCSVVESRVV